LKDEIQNGSFREDLFYRLNVVNIEVPTLRERKEDIPLLAAAFLKEFNKENGKSIEGITQKAHAALYNYPWPGNIRELRNCIESAVVLCKKHVIDVQDLPPAVTEGQDEDHIRIPLGSTMADAQRSIIEATLNYCSGNKSRTAEVLDIGRKTLHRKLLDYNID
jgi:DNA-binding NtrC family response regulator